MEQTQVQGRGRLARLADWIDARLPIKRAWDTHMGKYYAPKNFNFWYFFGVLSLLVLVIQLGTGIWLLGFYEPTVEGAFASVEYIMRDVPWGQYIRYMHSTGASAFFLVVYLHMFRALLYGSYRAPRELVWILGMALYVALMAEAFLGYVLPWGQMSYWGAQVIVNLFGSIPLVGEVILDWIRSDYLISGATLNKFMSLHAVAVPIVMLALVVLHLLALHEVGSNNPDGVEIKANKGPDGVPLDGVPFHPYYTVHDLLPVGIFLFVFCAIVFFFPEMGGYFLEHANFERANNLKTPEHIAPVWYFTPFYSMLRAVPDKLGGFMVMAAAIAILFVLPWLDKSPVRSIRYKGNLTRALILLFAASFIILGVLGLKAPSDARTMLARLCTIYYFAFFLAMPWWSRYDKVLPEPSRLTMQGLGLLPLIKGGILVALLATLPIMAAGAESELDCGTMQCEAVQMDRGDKASLQRGAKWYANYCMGCHGLEYARYERVADDLGISHDTMRANLIFGDQKIGELMRTAMTAASGAQWFGAAPPDLSLVTRARSPQWLYTYLLNFYQDPTRPLGVNNRVFPNVGMPHAMVELQGLARCVAGPVFTADGGIKQDPITGEPVHEDACHSLQVDAADAGLMDGQQYRQVVYDISNYLDYMADPGRSEREHLGFYVLLFILLFTVCAWLLGREYWRDIH